MPRVTFFDSCIMRNRNILRIVHEKPHKGYLRTSADFLFLPREICLTQGNLSALLGILEDAGYVKIVKTSEGKLTLTGSKLTATGIALRQYRQELQDFIGLHERHSNHSTYPFLWSLESC